MNAWHKLRLIVGRAQVARVNDAKKLQRLQVNGLADEVRDNVLRLQNFGHTGHPLPGCEVVIVSVGGSRDNAVAIAADDPRYRPTDLEPGETATYNAFGVKFHYTKDRDAILDCRKLIVRAQEIIFDAPQSTFTGAMTVQGLFSYLAGMSGQGGESGSTQITGNITHTDGSLTSNGKTLHTHTHPGDSGGTTGAPN